MKSRKTKELQRAFTKKGFIEKKKKSIFIIILSIMAYKLTYIQE